jgi:NAD(P)-dependent dehydrogenase (short-subunit alcohol dehydrogenase family)
MTNTLLITGVSTGFGRALSEAALAKNYRVVGTVRSEAAKAEFEALKPGQAFGRLLDVTTTAAIPRMVAEVERAGGAIDVLVNNAGYGFEGILEESTLDEFRHQFDVNVFGAIAMMQAVLPFMRKRRSGRILNITSMGGYTTFPGISAYHGSKFALVGISETVAKEVRDLGIFVTSVAPGGFRTDWAGRSLIRKERSIADYDAVFEPARKRRQDMSGKQVGDPKKAAAAMLTLIEAENPPMHLLLGSDALRLVREKLDFLKSEIDAWEKLTLSTDVDAV